MIVGIIIVCLFAALFLAALESERRPEPCPACPEGSRMEIVGEVRAIARVTGLRLGRAPNQSTRLARFRVAQMAGASCAALLMMDEGWL